MKKYNTIYYLLFILLIMGAFASMAQNNYGLKIIGAVAFVFGLVFVNKFISVLRKDEKKDAYTLIELACLFLVSIIFGFRVFYIHFPYIELLFTVAGILLMIIYLRKMFLRFRDLQPKNSLLAMLVLMFHLSVILFLFSLAMVPFVPKITEITGIIALVLLLSFIIAGFLKRIFLVEGERTSAFKTVIHFKDHSVIILSLFLLFSLYVGLNRIGAIPAIYSDEFPRAYYELVEKASSRKEKAVAGKYKYDEFKKQYDQFLKHNKIDDK